MTYSINTALPAGHGAAGNGGGWGRGVPGSGVRCAGPPPRRLRLNTIRSIGPCVGKTMNTKKSPNHKIYIQVLRQMSPEQRLLKAFELSEFANQLFIHGLRKRFPDLPEEDFQEILRERLDKCHNRNY
ncbi:MAG: hypothetical protein SVM79_07495 [Chloroflexota bacterium]|nr:hypothetical protein [Chloroflexota bacterium]